MTKLISNYRSQARTFVKRVIIYYALRIMRVASSEGSGKKRRWSSLLYIVMLVAGGTTSE